MLDRARVARTLATWFGCGRSPIAPGTVGSFAALPVHFVLRSLGPIPYGAAVIVVTAAGIWAGQLEAERLGVEDPQSVVIDEVAGTLLALFFVRRGSFAAQATAVVLFRVLDIVKPGLIHRAQDAKPEGLGIMADDLLAGAIAGITARWLDRAR